jgi:ribonuclease VapC
VIVDSSALVAILRKEPEAVAFAEIIESSRVNRISAAGYLETSIVIESTRDPVIIRRIDEFLREMRAIIEPVTERQARIAREAYRDFGRGSGHPANLNFSDCFAYALAIDFNESLLFKGDDFRKTDVKAAL